MLERLTHNFRLLLRAFGGAVCPLCAAREALERDEIARIRAQAGTSAALCGKHLEAYLAEAGDRVSQAWRTCKALEAVWSAGAPGCRICARLGAAETGLVHSIRRVDAGMRFRKALETAPLFCREHECLIVAGEIPENFAEVQRAKLRSLRDARAQAALCNSDEVKPLISSALAYLGQPAPGRALPDYHDNPVESANAECHIFEAWDNEQQLQHLGDLEAEAASLRYRNAVLSEENRRLKLAHAASEATRRDLEKDRAELLAAKDEIDAGSIKR